MRHITRCLNPRLSNMCMHALKLEEVSALLLDYLPSDLRNHCRVGSFSNGCLTLITKDSVWASQLRYIIPELRDTLRSKAKLYQLASIKITIDAKLVTHKLDSVISTSQSKQKKPSPWREILNHMP